LRRYCVLTTDTSGTERCKRLSSTTINQINDQTLTFSCPSVSECAAKDGLQEQCCALGCMYKFTGGSYRCINAHNLVGAVPLPGPNTYTPHPDNLCIPSPPSLPPSSPPPSLIARICNRAKLAANDLCKCRVERVTTQPGVVSIHAFEPIVAPISQSTTPLCFVLDDQRYHVCDCLNNWPCPCAREFPWSLIKRLNPFWYHRKKGALHFRSST
jgi:hypothetical protein